MSVDPTTPARPQVGYALTPAEKRSRKLRNVALAVVIGSLAVLFYVMTIAKMGAGFFTRPL